MSTQPTEAASEESKPKTRSRKVTQAQIDSKVVDTWFINLGEVIDRPAGTPELDSITLCVKLLKNRFVVIGQSACVFPEEYDKQLGEDLAEKQAIEKIWPLEGYLLAQGRYKEMRKASEEAKNQASSESSPQTPAA
jgi:hypothetical protein